MIERAESVLRDLGFRVCRVRHHDTIARLELGRDEMARALEPEVADAIDRELRALGYAARDARSARLPPRQPERGAAPAPDLSPLCAEACRRSRSLFLARASRAASRPRSKTSTPSTSRSACATSTSRSTSRIRPAIRVFIALGKLSTPLLRAAGVASPEVRGLAVWSALAGAGLLLLVFTLWRTLDPHPLRPALAAVMAAASPLFWFTSLRPLSDVSGLCVAVAALVFIARALPAGSSSAREPATRALLAGAIPCRSGDWLPIADRRLDGAASRDRSARPMARDPDARSGWARWRQVRPASQPGRFRSSLRAAGSPTISIRSAVKRARTFPAS